MSGVRTKLWVVVLVAGLTASWARSSDLLATLVGAPPSEARARWNQDGAAWIASATPFDARTRSVLTSVMAELAHSNPPLHSTVLSEFLSVTEGTPDHRFALTLRLFASPASGHVIAGTGFWHRVGSGVARARFDLYSDPVFGLPAAVRAGDREAMSQWIDAATTSSDVNPALAGRARLIAMLRDPRIAPLAALDELRRGGFVQGLTADDAAAIIAAMIWSGSISENERDEAFNLIAPAFGGATVGTGSVGAISEAVRGVSPEQLGDVIATLSDVIACLPALGTIQELNRVRSAAVIRLGNAEQIRAAAWVQSVLESSTPGLGSVLAWQYCDVDPGARGEAWGRAPAVPPDSHLVAAFERAEARGVAASDGVEWRTILTQRPLATTSAGASFGPVAAIEAASKARSLLAHTESLLAEIADSPLGGGAGKAEGWHAGRKALLIQELDRTVRVVAAWGWDADRPVVRGRLLALALGLVPTAPGYDAERVRMVDAVLSFADQGDVDDPLDVLIDASDHPSIEAELLYRQSARAVESGAFELASRLAQRASGTAASVRAWTREKHAASRLIAAVADLQRREYSSAEELLMLVSGDPLAGADQLSQASFLLGWLGLAQNDVSGARLWLAGAVDLHGGPFASSSLELVRRLEQSQIQR